MLKRTNGLVLQSRSSLLSLLFAGLTLSAACSEGGGERGATLAEPPAPIANSDLESAEEPSTATTVASAVRPEDDTALSTDTTADAGTDDITKVVVGDQQTLVTSQEDGQVAPAADASVNPGSPSTGGSYEDGASPDAASEGDAEICARTWYLDCDGDGYAAAGATSTVACIAPGIEDGCSWTSRAPEAGAIDCEDSSAAHHPGADYGLMITGKDVGLETLSCRPDGTYAPNSSLRCVVTTNPDLNCDGKLEPLPKGAAFLISGGHYIADLTHECGAAPDCGCWTKPAVSCGVTYGVSAYLCPGKGFGGETTLLCR